MDAPFPDHAQLANLSLIEELYRKYLADPQSVDATWRHFFEGIDFAGYLSHAEAVSEDERPSSLRIFRLIQAYRRFGHLGASFNPLESEPRRPDELSLEKLGFSEKELDVVFPSLGFCGKEKAPLKEILANLQNIYAANIGFEFMDLGASELEKWLCERLENKSREPLSTEKKLELWKFLAKTDLFEQFLHVKYAGKTRFSLEGTDAMIPLISELIESASEQGLDELLIGMAHRGRLGVLAQILEKSSFSLLLEFENDLSLSLFGSDDVKYHMGFSKEHVLPSGKKIAISMAPNPSHLESINPVVLGQVKALQIEKEDSSKTKISALFIHGDASIAGQGVVYETLQLMNVDSYSIGGAFHLVVNNQIGYTTSPKDSRSTRYCTDLAKAFSLPVFHVSAEDIEGCAFVAKLAAEVRQKFRCDVFIDLVGYRKYGHNEGDEPSYTQPLEYQMIRSKKSAKEQYAAKLIADGILSPETIETFEADYKNELSQALESAKSAPIPEDRHKTESLFTPFSSSVDASILQTVMKTYCELPPSFHLHPKLKKALQEREAFVSGDPQKPTIDWGAAELLAFGSLLYEKVPIRLAGEDSQRGTFSQRHIILIDVETGKPFSPLQTLQKARLDVINTPLTEFAGMAFEYGYSLSSPKTLVLWEAQYGDFNNGAQIVIDQYLVSAEKKWGTSSSLTLLLPHAYEGAGPEHSSARLERFLQLAADENIQVVNASTPAQYFHLLRRQALRNLKKPLIIFTPKSMLRSPLTLSPLNQFTHSTFQEILDDPSRPSSATRLILCSGKIYYELLAEREKQNLSSIALVRIEQLYPLHEQKLQQIVSSYSKISQLLFVQEESENAGAWSFLRPYLERLFPKIPLTYIGRKANPTTATGSQKKHKLEQQEIIERAIGASPQPPPKD